MSSYRAQSALSCRLIKLILSELGQAGRLSMAQLISNVQKPLNPREQKALGLRGGPREIKRLLYYLRARGYLKYVFGKGERAVYHLSTKGWGRLEDLNYEPLSARHKKWDGKWRVVIFDIPESERAARDALRRLIKQLGFRRLQRSVWIHPLPCEQEIDEISQAYGVQAYVTLLRVESFDRVEEYRNMFADELSNAK